MKDSVSSHLVPSIGCTKVDGDSDFDIIKIKKGGERRRNRQSLGMIRTPKTYDEEVCLIKNMKQAKRALDMLVRAYGKSDVMEYNGAPEKVGPHTKFQANMRKYGTKGHTDDTKRSN